MPEQRAGHAAGVVDGVLYVVGGSEPHNSDTLFAYDPFTNTWTVKAPAPTRRGDGAASVVDGIMYVVGGYHFDAFGGETLNSVEAYNPKTNTWTDKAPMPTPRQSLAVGMVDGIVYAIGGHIGGFGTTDKVEAYNPKTNTWISRSSMPTPREGLAVAAVGGNLYAIGGANNGVRVAQVDTYDPKSNTWSTRSSMPTPRWGLAAGAAGGIVYVVGGAVGVGTVEAYDPKSDSWSTAPPLASARWGLAVGVVADVLYAVGGAGEMRTIFSLNEAFSPFLPVAIDIKPGDERNTINLKSQGVVGVAILGSATFDPLTVDPSTVTLAGAPVATRGRGVPMTSQGDTNRDGYLDLLLFFRTQDLQLAPGATEAVLYGTTTTGQRIRGADLVRIIRVAPAARSGAPATRNRVGASTFRLQ